MLPKRTVLLIALIAACGDDDAAEEVTSPPVDFPIPTASYVSNFTYVADTPRRDVFRVEIPMGFRTLDALGADFMRSLPHLDITRDDGGNSPGPTLTAILRVAPGDVGMDACDSDPVMPMLTVTGDEAFTPQTVEPTTATADDMLINMVNAGTLTVCVESTASVDATLSLGMLYASFALTARGCGPPQDIAGTWSGDYTCQDRCGAEESDVVSLTIRQNGHNAFYFDDGDAFYFGTVCDNRFTFSGVGLGYSESGVFVRTGDTTATKESSYENNDDDCGGDCSDMLTLQQ